MVFVKTFSWFKAMVQRATQPVQGSEIIGSIKLRKREQGQITLSYFRLLFTNAPPHYLRIWNRLRAIRQTGGLV